MASKLRGSAISTIYTIGHSNQKAVDFIDLLKQQDIELLVDVRSKPYSRFRHFNRELLRDRLVDQGIQYLHLGDELGGHPPGTRFYEKERVIYQRLATLPGFRRGIKQVIDQSERSRIVLMCAEEKPEECHRHPLLASELLERGVQVFHIRRDGSVEDASTFTRQPNLQLPLFEPDGEDLTWQSPKPIRPRD